MDKYLELLLGKNTEYPEPIIRNIFIYKGNNAGKQAIKVLSKLPGNRLKRIRNSFYYVGIKPNRDFPNDVRVKFEGEGIYAVKGFQDRFYGFFENISDDFIVVCYDQKKQNKANPEVLNRAKRIRSEYLNLIKEVSE